MNGVQMGFKTALGLRQKTLMGFDQAIRFGQSEDLNQPKDPIVGKDDELTIKPEAPPTVTPAS